VQLEGLGKLKISTSFGTQTGDLLACSIVSQPITLPHASCSEVPAIIKLISMFWIVGVSRFFNYPLFLITTLILPSIIAYDQEFTYLNI
jgi:hypothetical protein